MPPRGGAAGGRGAGGYGMMVPPGRGGRPQGVPPQPQLYPPPPGRGGGGSGYPTNAILMQRPQSQPPPDRSQYYGESSRGGRGGGFVPSRGGRGPGGPPMLPRAMPPNQANSLAPSPARDIPAPLVKRPVTTEIGIQTNPVLIRSPIPQMISFGCQVEILGGPQNVYLTMLTSEESMARMEILSDMRMKIQDILLLSEQSQRRAYEVEARNVLKQQELSSRTHLDMFESRQRETLLHHWTESLQEINMFLMLSPRRSSVGSQKPLAVTNGPTTSHSTSLSSDPPLAVLPLISPSPPSEKHKAPPPTNPPTLQGVRDEYVPKPIAPNTKGYVRSAVEALERDRVKESPRPRRSPPQPPVERGLYGGIGDGAPYIPYTMLPQGQGPYGQSASVSSPPPHLQPSSRSSQHSLMSDNDGGGAFLREQSFRAMNHRLVNLQYI